MSHRSKNGDTEKSMNAVLKGECTLDCTEHLRATIHDLKSPLTSIILKVDLIKRIDDDRLSDKVSAHLEQIQQISQHMNEMLEQLLRPTERHNPLEGIQVIEVSPIIQAILDEFSLQLQNQNITVIVSSDLPSGLAHPDQLTSIFTNLIGNAIKYIGENNPEPYIHIRAFQQGNKVRYEVQDNGVGINPDDQPCAFEPHTRFHHNLANGSGLGLSIVRSIVSKLGGCVGIDSEPGHGSTFWFILPACAYH